MVFHNVELTGPANVYFDGRVSSRTFYTADGERMTLGFILAGEYTFNAEYREHLEILAGSLEVAMDDADTYTRYEVGGTFDIPAGSAAHMRTDSFADYSCGYLIP
ncbi:MAG: pyrimidine/purine nucleoside phosphorylase [Oscillospiraceae bacterium]